MSLGARATKGGAKTAARDGKHTVDKKTDKPQPKEKVKPQATTEQLRMAHMIDRKNDDASDVRRMVLDLMEMTCRTEEEVCSALHDADNDMQAACNLLLEETTRIQGEWQTSEKKKKKPPAAVGNGEVEPPPRDPRSRSGPRPRRGEGEGFSRGRGSAGRGRGGAGRGGRGARRGAPGRAGAPGAAQGAGWSDGGHTATGGNMGDSFPTTEDWDNEEWSGSLSDTKVFTPSTQSQPPDIEHSVPANVCNSAEDWDTPAETNNGHSSPHIPSYTYHSGERAPPIASAGLGVGVGVSAAPPPPDLDSLHTPQPPLAHTVNIPMGMSGSLSAAQTQYLTQLTQQSQRHDNSVYTSNYGVYGATDLSSQRKPQRARVPPPSKIPSSAVEMPGGGEAGGASLLDVQFGALEPELTRDSLPPDTHNNKPQPHAPAVASHPAPLQPPPAPAHEPAPDLNNAYSNTNTSMLSESLQAVVDSAPSSQPAQPEPVVSNTSSLEKQLSSGMKQLSVSPATLTTQQYTQHRPKTVGQQNVYASHHAVSHHPQVYGANVYATPVNSSVPASLSGQPGAMSAGGYPSIVTTLSQYQPMINSYQQTSSSATVYGGAALYTAAPYTYQQPHSKLHKDSTQYDGSVASSNSLTNTSTTQTSTAKVTTTTASSGATAANSASNSAAYAAQAQAQAQVQASPAAAALYGQAAAAAAAAAGGYPTYDEQYRAGTMPHHMGGYYEVGYGVSGAREGTFGLGAGERFGRADAASPQQVPAALPPGYAYFYQPPPTTYQYGVYPYGGGSSVGGVGGVTGAGKVSNYTQQQPPYEQDTYKAGGGYAGGGKPAAAGGGASSDLGNAMYANKHVALNKVNSYDKAQYHGGTPPPFGAGSHHVYIPGPPHHLHHHQLQQHQMDVRVNSSQVRRESGGGGANSGAGAGGRAASKPPNKPAYSQSYWPPN